MSNTTTLPWSLGHTGNHIHSLQQLLNHHGSELACDGHFGPNTFAAVCRFQRENALVVDGVVGRKTLTTLRGARNIWLSEVNITDAAEQLGVDIPAIRAVYAVESNGYGFLDDGRPVILYERHVMRRQLLAHGHAAADVMALESLHPSLINKTPGGYKGGSTEHYRLRLASHIDLKAALESCSWGLFQIMGLHWQRLGYESLAAFVTAMTHSEGEQLHALVRFIQTDKKLHNALQNHQWSDFARIYNGSGYKKNAYHTRLAQHYAACKASIEAGA